MKKLLYILVACLILVCCDQQNSNEIIDCGVVDEQQVKFESQVFKENCLMCHLMSSDKVIGPGLLDIEERTPSRGWARGFVINEMIDSIANHPYTIKINKDSEIDYIHNFEQLTEEEINHLLDFMAAYYITE